MSTATTTSFLRFVPAPDGPLEDGSSRSRGAVEVKGWRDSGGPDRVRLVRLVEAFARLRAERSALRRRLVRCEAQLQNPGMSIERAVIVRTEHAETLDAIDDVEAVLASVRRAMGALIEASGDRGALEAAVEAVVGGGSGRSGPGGW